MWVKLISPKMSLRPMDTELKRRMSPPLSLLVLGALTPAEHTVTVEDENIETLNLDDTPDVVGITVKVDTANRAYEIAKMYRSRGVKVVLGGIHPTACPDEACEHADVVVAGEAEMIWPGLLRDIEQGKHEKLYYQDTPVPPENIPVPRWELIKGKDYLYTNTLYISRGCPWKCEFCYNSSPNVSAGHRVKSSDLLLEELQTLDTKHVMFIDDNFVGSPSRAKQILAAIKPLGLLWHTAVSTDILNHPDLLDMMADAGCKSLFVGFESINPANLKSCSKVQNKVEDYSRLVRAIHKRGMMVNASLVFGFDNDTRDVFSATLDWLVENKIESMTAHVLTPYPGTKWYESLKSQGRIIENDYDSYNTSNVVFQPAKMSPEELRQGYLWMYEQFYSARNIFKRYPGGAYQIAPFLLFNLIYRKFGKLAAALYKVKGLNKVGRAARRLSYRIK